ncbi:MAG TPA: DegT/DnrJ/EryC1/StrS family aminotransferase [Gemmatimonadales bacterium]|nr:DegT/DnrJ/EryC1/StrS family aminotransferase [Gemmatimonadales bacterium]
MTDVTTPPAIPITRAVFDEAEAQAVARVLESGWVVQGPRVAEFEAGFRAFTGLPEAVACTSCTTGLHLALLAEGIGPGDEVIVPSFTWVASANAAIYVGATPVIADVSLETFNVTAEEIERRITPRTRAIMAVHLFGLAAEMDEILPIARARGIKVIEDAACALGTLYRGRHVGAIGDGGAFSFHPRKAITTGEGGMYTTADPARAAQARSLRDHGAAKSDHARHSSRGAALLPVFEMVGYNYRMTDLQAAVGVAQLAKLEGVLAARIARAKRYDELLTGVEGLVLPVEPEGHRHSYQSYVCRIPTDRNAESDILAGNAYRNAVMSALEEDRIATRQGTHAVHMLGYYARTYGFTPMDFPGAFAADHLSLSLPLYAQMTDEEQDRVVERLAHHLRTTDRPRAR